MPQSGLCRIFTKGPVYLTFWRLWVPFLATDLRWDSIAKVCGQSAPSARRDSASLSGFEKHQDRFSRVAGAIEGQRGASLVWLAERDALLRRVLSNVEIFDAG